MLEGRQSETEPGNFFLGPLPRFVLVAGFQLAIGTGRRIGAILPLRYCDLRLNVGTHGALIWPADTDKLGKEWAAPLNALARAAIDRVLAQRPGIGTAYLFPRANQPSRPVSKELAYSWFRKAEDLAKLSHLPHGGWHTLRRSWATSRKHLPLQDVMAAGGWSDPTSLQTAYQQADVDTLQKVVDEGTEVRAVRG